MRFDTYMAPGEPKKARSFRSRTRSERPHPEVRTFRPDIGKASIRSKLRENPCNIRTAGQIDMLISGWG